MERLIALLKETAVFMLAAQMILHFGPGKKYEKYGKITMTLVVLALLGAPLLSLGKQTRYDAFLNRLNDLEADNRMFSGKLDQMEGAREDLFYSSFLLSVEEQVSQEAQAAKVAVEDVRLEEGRLVIAVRAAGEADQKSQIRQTEIARITVGQAKRQNAKTDQGETDAAGQAIRGRMRQDLADSFGAALQMEADSLEVIELE